MAIFLDKNFLELIQDAPKRIRSGMSGTEMWVFPAPDFPGRGIIVEWNSRGRVIGHWEIREGWDFRITPNKVKELPPKEEDPNVLRRYFRLRGIPLNRIIKIKKGDKSPKETPLGYITPGGEENEIHQSRHKDSRWVLFVVKGQEPKTISEVKGIIHGSKRIIHE